MPKTEQPLGGQHGMVVMDAGGKKLCGDKAPVPVLRPAGETRCSGGTGSEAGRGDAGAAAPQSLLQEGDGDGGLGTNPASATNVWTCHSKLSPRVTASWMGTGRRKAPGARHSRNAAGDPVLDPLLPEAGCCRGSAARVGCGMPTGTKAFPTATGSREPDFGSQSTKEQHGREEGTRNLHLAGSFPPCEGGERGRSKAFPSTGCFALCRGTS